MHGNDEFLDLICTYCLPTYEAISSSLHLLKYWNSLCTCCPQSGGPHNSQHSIVVHLRSEYLNWQLVHSQFNINVGIVCQLFVFRVNRKLFAI